MKPDEIIQTERRALETMSETSEGTATASVAGQNFESREELLELAALLQLTDLDDLHRERFRVDRRKLEHMLLGDNEAPEPADTFFHKIMDETNTFVTWPSRLKIGAKSKKDPHIKVAGRLDDVRAAKEKIMQILDTRQSMRVTMKLDVSYTDHSHIIGKGGLTIKRVMEETGCHIHFPDSNRSNHQEKSNQVSIAGEMEGVEKARARVRSLTPLIFSFELPIMRSMQSQPDSTSPYIIKIQEKYNVQVMFRTRPKLHATLVVVKGCEWEVPQVKEATLFLIHHMCKNLANQIQVQMSMEISPQHHSIVLGKQSNNLKLIMQRTSTQIMFPDAGDPNIPSLKKSNVMITGSIHNVYLARQQLVGSLPLVLMFDLPENSMQTVDTENISQLMQTLDVFINVRHKPKQSTLSVIIKGVERNATNIYEARRQLLNLEEPMIEAKLPLSLQIPKNLFQGNSGNTKTGSFMGITENFNNMLSINTQNQSPFCLSPLSVSPNGLSPQWNIPSQVSSMFSPLLHPSFSYNHPNAQLLAATRAAMQSNILNQQAMNLPGQNLLGLGRSHPPGFPPNAYQNGNNDSVGSSSKSGSLSDNKETNYMSISSTSSTLSSPAISPRNVSPIESADISMNLGYNTSVLSDLSMLEEKNEQKKFDIGTTHLMPFDYEQKKLLALKAIQNKPKSSEYRIPTPTWSGYGLSQTMPAVHTPTEKTANESKCSISDPSDLWDDPTTPLVYMGQVIDFDNNRKESVGMNSLYIDHTPQSKLNKIISGAHTDLTTTLNSVGLEKYIRTFSSHEIDMSTFLSLTDKDLTEIGITAWGARRKILLLISEMNKRTKPFSGSAAPGAERKSSLTNVSTTVNENNMEGKW